MCDELIFFLDLVERWGSLKTRAELHTARQLQKDMASLKDELATLSARVQAMETNVTSREELDDKISQVKVNISGTGLLIEAERALTGATGGILFSIKSFIAK